MSAATPRLSPAQRALLATCRQHGAVTMYGANGRTIDRLVTLGLLRYAYSAEVNARLGRSYGMQGGYVLTEAGEQVA